MEIRSRIEDTSDKKETVDPESIASIAHCFYYVEETAQIGPVADELGENPEIPALGVVDKMGKAVGKIEREHFFNILGKHLARDVYSRRPINKLMESVQIFHTCQAISDVADALTTELHNTGIKHYVLVDRTDTFYGLFSTADLLLYLKNKVDEQAAELALQNKQIMESIQYAQIIQSAILPKSEMLDGAFRDYFIICKQAHTVGGDFYFFEQLEDFFLLAVADCTGHGVPGAFMTMIAYSALNRILDNMKLHDPAAILSALNAIIKRDLNQQSDEAVSDDGLDIGICLCNPKEKRLVFAGAKIHLYIHNHKGLTEVRANKQSIGYKRSKDTYVYTNHTIEFEETEMFYLATDGFKSQIGGEKSFPFGTGRMRQLFSHHYHKPLPEQKKLMLEAWDRYRGEEPQTDDMTIFGFSV